MVGDEVILFRKTGASEAIVCAPMLMTAREIADFANARRRETWRISEASHFETGELNPSPCPSDVGHVHYLLTL